MSSEPPPDWRFVIRAYLDAQYEDARQRHAAELTNCEARCLREFAAAPLWTEYEQMIQRRMAALGNTPPESAYQVIEESGERVVAQVAHQRGSRDSGIPFFTTRFVLSRGLACWNIAEILHVCFGCNPLMFEGRGQIGTCFACGGSGELRWMQPQGWWIFRRLVNARKPCTFCDGTGRCKHCVASPQRGWTKVYRQIELAALETSAGEL